MKRKIAYIQKLKEIAPNISICVSREQDEYCKWDGDGPDPRKRGFKPYNVDVSARMIVQGEVIEGEASMGGSYYLESEPLGEVHGYLPQMVEEAIEELSTKLAILGETRNPQVEMALAHLKQVMRDKWQDQQPKPS